MRDRLDELDGASVAAVTFAPQPDLGAHRAHLALPFPLLTDPERSIYSQFGIGRGSFSEIWSLGTLKMYGRLMRAGWRPRAPVQDTRQLGGDFVIDAQGKLTAAFLPRSPDSRPSIDSLVSAVSRAAH